MTKPLAIAAGKQLENAAGFVLAGGRSSRMGTDKALVELNGQPLIAHALQILQDSELAASIAGARNPDLARFAPVVSDTESDRGPLAGICAALASTSAPLAVFLSVDAPLIPASLIRYMLHHARVTESPITLASITGFAQTFPVVVHRRALPALESSLRSSHTGCFAAFQSAAKALATPLSILPVERLVQSGHVEHPEALPGYLWFANINSPADLERIASLQRNMGVVS